MRLIVNLVGDAAHGRLAASDFVRRSFLPGGEHNMYELAFAAAALGHDVELRGWIEPRAFARLRDAAGSAPVVKLAARPPTPDDLVVVPEGWQNQLEYARLILSPARLAMFVLAAPGLFGWWFGDSDQVVPDPLTVALDAVARPEHFQSMHELGFELLTHSPGLVQAADRAGVACALVGTGRPAVADPPAQDAPRPVDVAGLLANRWAPLVRETAAELQDLTIDLIEEAPNDEVLARLARARVLLWPSRIEGHATIPWEARTVGCVPVALSSNRFAVGLSDAAGAVMVDDVAGLAAAVRSLLADPQRLQRLSRAGVRTSREEVEWTAYVDRVRAFLDAERPARPSAPARAAMGEALLAWEADRARESQTRLELISAELERVHADRDRIAYDLQFVGGVQERTQIELERTREQLAALRNRRAVRAALRVADVRRRDDS